MSKHAVDTVALNALITAFQQSSDLPAKEVHKLITDVSSTAIAVTIKQPEDLPVEAPVAEFQDSLPE